MTQTVYQVSHWLERVDGSSRKRIPLDHSSDSASRWRMCSHGKRSRDAQKFRRARLRSRVSGPADAALYRDTRTRGDTTATPLVGPRSSRSYPRRLCPMLRSERCKITYALEVDYLILSSLVCATRLSYLIEDQIPAQTAMAVGGMRRHYNLALGPRFRYIQDKAHTVSSN